VALILVFKAKRRYKIRMATPSTEA